MIRSLARFGGMSAALATVSLIVGCGAGDGPSRFDVSGTVTHNGQPIPRGTIQFQPDASQGNSGPAASADIVDGKYDTSSQGSGTVGGPHIVIIQGFDGKARPEDELLLGEPLFEDYKTTADMPTSAGDTVDFQIDQ